MSWTQRYLTAACQGLRHAAKAGEFVPYHWNAGFKKHGNGCGIRGCGWGQVAWIIAVMQGGVNHARTVLPIGSGQSEVNAVLRSAGLTRAEIKSMAPAETWTTFDSELEQAYEARGEDYQSYIDISKELAEFFVDVLMRVPVEVKAQHGLSISSRVKASLSALLGSSAEGKVLEAV